MTTELPPVTKREIIELTVGEFIDTCIDIHILRKQVSDERLHEVIEEQEGTADEIIETLWKQIEAAMDKKFQLSNQLITMCAMAPWELNELEQEMIDEYYDQQTESI